MSRFVLRNISTPNRNSLNFSKCYAMLAIKYRWGVRKRNFSKYKSSFMSKPFLLKVFFKIKLSFSLGGTALSGASTRGKYLVLALLAPRFLVEDRRSGIKKSAMFQPSEASSTTTRHYGLCLG